MRFTPLDGGENANAVQAPAKGNFSPVCRELLSPVWGCSYDLVGARGTCYIAQSRLRKSPPHDNIRIEMCASFSKALRQRSAEMGYGD